MLRYAYESFGALWVRKINRLTGENLDSPRATWTDSSNLVATSDVIDLWRCSLTGTFCVPASTVICVTINSSPAGRTPES